MNEKKRLSMKKLTLLSCVILAGLLFALAPAEAREVYQDGQVFYELIDDNGITNDALQKPITIHVDGKFLPSDVTPTIKNNRTVLPLRTVGEALNASVQWNNATQTATATKDGHKVSFTLGSKTYYVDGQARYADIAPFVIKSRTMLPLRAFAEAFNTTVHWDSELYDVVIDTPAPNQALPSFPADFSPQVTTFFKKYAVAPSTNDSLVGTWYKKEFSDWIQQPTTELIFITRYQDHYHSIILHATPINNSSASQMEVYRDSNACCTDYTNQIYKLSTLNIYYWFGYGGSPGPNDNYYKIVNGELQFNGWYNYLEDRYHNVPPYQYDSLKKCY